MRLSDIDEGFNNIKPWLSKKLEERGITSVESFCVHTGSVINPTAVWRWYSDAYRPYARTMKVVCETLSKLPIKLPNGDEYLEHVPWSEGLATYSPRPRAWAAHFANKPTPDRRQAPAASRRVSDRNHKNN